MRIIQRLFPISTLELIETLWNVNSKVWLEVDAKLELIETLWNVNVRTLMRRYNVLEN